MNKSYTAGRNSSGKLRPWIKLPLIGVCILLVLIGSGFGYEWLASRQAAPDYPPPGKMIDAGGYRLHLQKFGSGSPTIVLEAASGETSISWRDIPKQLAQFSTVVVYDRGSFAWSDKATTTRSGPHIVHELHTALQQGHIPGPYIIVGHSLGGMYARLFAQTYQRDIAGLVLLDAKPVDDDSKTAAILAQEHFQKPLPLPWVSKLLKQSGVMRLFQHVLLEGLVRYEDRDKFINVIAKPDYFDAVEEEGRSIPLMEDLIRNQNLGDIPVRIIARGLIPPENAKAGFSQAASRKIEDIWQAGQKQMLQLSTDSKLIIAKNSGHYIIHDEPGLVVNVIGQLINETAAQKSADSN